MTSEPTLNLGSWRHLDGTEGGEVLRLPAAHLVTHGVVVGMTGSGKTGLVTVLLEEALGAGVPTIVIDVKGDLPNLLLGPPSFLAEHSVRVITPGATSGEPLHVLSSLERRSRRWEDDPETARESLSAAVSLLLRLLGRDADRERVVDGLAASLDAGAAEGDGEQELARTVQRLAPRWFVVRNAHSSAPPLLLRPRDTLTPLIGPMTRTELRRARTQRTAPMPGTAAASRPHAAARTDPGADSS